MNGAILAVTPKSFSSMPAISSKHAANDATFSDLLLQRTFRKDADPAEHLNIIVPSHVKQAETGESLDESPEPSPAKLSRSRKEANKEKDPQSASLNQAAAAQTSYASTRPSPKFFQLPEASASPALPASTPDLSTNLLAPIPDKTALTAPTREPLGLTPPAPVQNNASAVRSQSALIPSQPSSAITSKRRDGGLRDSAPSPASDRGQEVEDSNMVREEAASAPAPQEKSSSPQSTAQGEFVIDSESAANDATATERSIPPVASSGPSLAPQEENDLGQALDPSLTPANSDTAGPAKTKTAKPQKTDANRSQATKAGGSIWKSPPGASRSSEVLRSTDVAIEINSAVDAGKVLLGTAITEMAKARDSHELQGSTAPETFNFTSVANTPQAQHRVTFGKDEPAMASSPAAQPPQPLNPVVHSAYVLERMGQTEMRIGVKTAGFGNVELRTSISHDLVGATIVTSHGGLREAMLAEAPSLTRAIADHQLQLNLNLNESGGGRGSAGQRDAQPDRGSSPWTGQRSDCEEVAVSLTAIPGKHLEAGGLSSSGLNVHA